MSFTNNALRIEFVPITTLIPDPQNARRHSSKQIKMLAKAITSLGFNNPVLADKNNILIAGHGRLEAARLLNMTQLPVIRLEHLTPEQVRAYRLADNRIAELAEWDQEALVMEFKALSEMDLDFDLDVTGFETPEIDIMIMGRGASVTEEPVVMPDPRMPVITEQGDLWQLGAHKLICGNSLEENTYQALLQNQLADLIFTDPPYNVPVNGHVLTNNKHNHSEFAMASGEMSEHEFQQFLKTCARLMAQHSKEGSIHYICMDWRHIYDLLQAGRGVYDTLKNICVWNKANGGMGSLYRSKHEMVCVFKKGTAPHCNNVELGKHGRYRTNVWDYAGQSTIHPERDEVLAMHPTVKPVAMIADAILDCSHRSDIILDPFGGSGSTLIAAEQTGRIARLIEIDPRYVDVAIQRWQNIAEANAIHVQTGMTFSEMAEQRGKVCIV